jgi:glycosyltransferase involved in cell wall biosynthesis
MKPLRICIDSRFVTGTFGGCEQFVIGLASGLSKLTDGSEEYFFLTYLDEDEWLRPYISPPCRILPASLRSHPAGAKRLLAVVPGAKWAWEKWSPWIGRRAISIPHSDGRIEREGIDLMHFTQPIAFLTGIPSIYHPHDLQHVHLPQFFTPRIRMARDLLFRTFCGKASMVSVTSTWGKRDLIRQYGLPQEKIMVVPLAPPLSAYPLVGDDDLAATREKYRLPERFILYPAQTFPHKNHLGLLDALALLRDRRELRIPLVCSGHKNEFFKVIEKRVSQLGLKEQTRFVGFVSPVELQCLYRLCTAVVIPTKFEAASFPLWEAFLAGAPAACSNVTSLPEQADDAALIFEPDRADQIASAIERLWTDSALCRRLVEKGHRQVSLFTWERTTRLFRAHYRRLASRALTDEDRSLLSEPDRL